jgi:hypothetical protein
MPKGNAKRWCDVPRNVFKSGRLLLSIPAQTL